MKSLPDLVIWALTESASFDDLFHTKPVVLETDWRGLAFSPPVSFYIAKNSARLFFGAARESPPVIRESNSGFRAGLWQREAAELFLGRCENERYQELHIAPGGAWWTAVFDGYRRQVDSWPALTVSTHSERIARGWKAALSCPLAELAVPFRSPTGLIANVCYSVGGPDPLLAAVNPGAGKPDFHDSNNWLRGVISPHVPS